MSIRSASALSRPVRRGLIVRVLQRAVQALVLQHHRRALLRLDAHLLRDIGLTEAEARREAARPVWDVPQHWRS